MRTKIHFISIRRCMPIAFLMLLNLYSMSGQVGVDSLRVEYQREPLGLDAPNPRFSWQMVCEGPQRGLSQESYRLRVTAPGKRQVWDSGRKPGNSSLGISYEGDPLQPRTEYEWEVTVWDQEGTRHEAGSRFETGLMSGDPDSAVWNGAQWIGGKTDDIPFYSHYLSVFKLNCTLQLDRDSKSIRAALVLGANDPRLMDRNLNVQGVASGKNGHYIAFELDISALEKAGGGPARLQVFRVGYSPEDGAQKPFRTFDIPADLISETNKYEPHQLFIKANFGLFELFLDGTDEAHRISQSDDNRPAPYGNPGFNLNPVGSGNNYISFPMLGNIGFKLEKGQKACISEIQIRNFREPSNVLYAEKPGSIPSQTSLFSGVTGEKGITFNEQGLHLYGGEQGLLITADPSRNAMPMLRADFTTADKPVSKARIYSTARGIYELYLNGKRVGEDYFAPGLTQYNKTQQYQTYDVTASLKSGTENTIGAWLGEGWWSGNITYSGSNWNYFGDRSSIRTLLVITYVDGTEQLITSRPENWKLFTDGPLRYGSFFQGEVYDASREGAVTGWAKPNFDDSNWKEPVEVPTQGTTYPGLSFDSLQLIAQLGHSPTVVKQMPARSVEEVRDGVFVYDMGQNMVGFPRIRIDNGRKGDTLILRYAEVRYPDLPEYEELSGMIMLENIRAALTQDLYILKGGPETIQPRFTFHGFRFLEITGIDKPIPTNHITGQVVSSVQSLASMYETSNPLVNKLWENITWSLRGNFLSIPTDTPARNERMGWSGDINVFSEAAVYLTQADRFLARHLRAMRDMQREDGRFTDVAPVGGGFGGTLWGSAGIVIPWEVYQQYGDKQALADHFQAMKRYMAFLDSKVDGTSGHLVEGPLGDWLSPEGSRNDNTLFWAAYQVYDLDIMARVAKVLDKPGEAEIFRKKQQERKAYFNATYVDPRSHKTRHSGYEGAMFGPPPPGYEKPRPGDLVDTQASYAIPLHLEVFNKENEQYAADYLAAAVARKNTDDLGITRPENSLMTGFIGTAALNQALSENGQDSLAYTLLQQQTYPSWLYSVVNGATTIWERLNSYTREDGFGGNNSMNSFNHYSFGAVAAWMYNHSLGIERDRNHPAFSHFILKPVPDPTGKMTWARGYYDSMYGRIESGWKVLGSETEYRITVPPNTTATLFLNAGSATAVTEGGMSLEKARGAKVAGISRKRLNLELASGSYLFLVKNKPN